MRAKIFWMFTLCEALNQLLYMNYIFNHQKNHTGQLLLKCSHLQVHLPSLNSTICVWGEKRERERKKKDLNYLVRDFPGGPVVESSCQCRGHGSSSWSGKTQHAVGRLSPYVITTEPASPRGCALQHGEPSWWAAPLLEKRPHPLQPERVHYGKSNKSTKNRKVKSLLSSSSMIQLQINSVQLMHYQESINLQLRQVI